MGRWVIVIITLLCLVVPITAQQPNREMVPSVASVTGSIDANAETVTLVANGRPGLTIQITGTFTGTMEFEASIDGTNYASMTMFPTDSTVGVTQATATGIWAAGFVVQNIRVRSTAWTTGTAVVDIYSGASGAGGVGGGGGSAGTEYTEGTTDATITGTALMWEDAADTLAPVAAGTPLPVTCATCSGTGVQHIDDAVFTNATDDIIPVGGQYDTTPDPLNDGDAGVVRMGANRDLFTGIRDAAGNDRGLNVDANGDIGVTVEGQTGTLEVVGDAAENAAVAGNPVLTGGRYDTSARTLGNGDVGAIALDVNGNVSVGGTALTDIESNTSSAATDLSTLVAGLSTDGTHNTTIQDVGPESMGYAADFDGVALPGSVAAEGRSVHDARSLYGVGYRMIVNEDGSKSVFVTEDVAHADADLGALAITVRQDTAATTAGTSGDNAAATTDALGRMWVRRGDPCSDHARISFAAISETTAATNEIVALNGSDLIYVCSYKWVTTAANSLNWVHGTGTDCATGTTSIEGAQPYAANGGAAESGGGAPLFVVPAGNALCLTSSAATAHGGRVSYVRTAAP